MMKAVRIGPAKDRNQRLAENMTLREVLEFTREVPLQQGGLIILLERLVEEIEKLKSKNESN